jgi:hypothetical protein
MSAVFRLFCIGIARFSFLLVGAAASPAFLSMLEIRNRFPFERQFEQGAKHDR